MNRKILGAGLLATIGVWLGGCSAPTAVNSELSKLLEANDFTLYTPFRSEDGPGTIFVIAPNQRGQATEFTLSTPDRTFKQSVNYQDLLRPQNVALANELSRKRTFSTSAAAQLLSQVVDMELAGKYASEITITFGAQQRAHLLSQEVLTAHKSDINPTTIETLRFYKSKEQLDNVFFVFETLEVSSLRAVAKIKKEFSGMVSFEQLEPALKAGARLENVNAETFEVSFNSPMLIGYKAVSIPNTIISGAVSPEDVLYSRIETSVINRLKGR